MLSGPILAMLNAFGQTNTEPKQITSYVADSIGLPISTQQVRNLMNARLGHGSFEERLKVVILEFAADETNKSAIIQGDWDQTICIVLQTNAQREIFSRWGETLAPDWTHNCTNLGFYVGNLVATAATGRGVSVLDFLCLNQQKETLLAVLSWFKDKNPSWTQLQSLVIDKDFTECSTRREVFPQASVSRATGESKNAAAVHVRLIANSRIAYVKLKKGEVSEHTVVSDCEKYNVVRAEVMSLVDSLQLLPRYKFYEVFADLRATIEVFMKKWSLEGSAQRDGGDDIESDGGLDDLEVEEDVIEVAEVEQLQPGSFERRGSSNVVPTATLQCIAQEGTSNDLHLDINDGLDECCLKNPSQVSMPDLDMSEQSQELLQRTFTTGSRTDTDLDIEQEKALEPKRSLATNLDVLNLPVPSTTQ
ncbi:hypothetical protein PI124_g8013 [Phytophthora idaei]|nr:hypothetical protein PI124_g8013 [Phytophthora idaei]